MRFGLFLLAALSIPAHADESPRAGANWWALQPIPRIIPPVPRGHATVTHPVDAFIRARLKTAGLAPTGPAEKRVLIRRVTFDLIGLPPTPAEVDAFIADTAPDAFERVVDRLLASPHYGERWARHWLDVVRYSESHGFEYDRLRDNAWRYRDYVIRSLNADKPYADFVREQIAGDVSNPAFPDGVIATGMLVAGPYDQAGMSSRSTTVRAKAREDELEDMLGTVSQTFLGITLNCARCHDHKVDPFTARDYYRLKAVFDGTVPGDRSVYPASEMRARKEAAGKLQDQLDDLYERIDRLEAAARARLRERNVPNRSDPGGPKPISQWTFESDGRDATGPLHAEPRDGARFAQGRLILDGNKAFAQSRPLAQDLAEKTLEAWVYLPTLRQGGGGVMTVQTVRGNVFDSIVFAERKPMQWIAGSENHVRTRDVSGPDERALPDEPVHLAISYARDGRISLYRNGKPYGDSYVPQGSNRPVAFRNKESQVVFGLRHTGGGNAFLRAEVEEARLYDTALTPNQVANSFRGGIERFSADEIRMAMSDADRLAHDTARRQASRLENEFAPLRDLALTYAVTPKEPGPTYFLKRGDVEKPGDPVPPGSPAAVQGPPPLNLPDDSSEGNRRSEFAMWVVHPDNPLTWRVIVNRVWQHHFGEGLVRTPNDFGFNGEQPTHPELLDWLALQFRDSGGHLKSLHRLILTSETYRQGSAWDARAAEADAENRLLWRQAPRRLEAEAVRDAMLAVSGKLNREGGGPSARPFRIETFNSAFYILFDEDQPRFNRRAVYRMNVTSARDPILDVLDCPDPSVKTPRRNTTTTPLQALALMNNPFSDRMSRSFAERVHREAGARIEDQVDLAYQIAFGRLPRPDERTRASNVIRNTGLRAVCWALLNTSEFVYLK